MSSTFTVRQTCSTLWDFWIYPQPLIWLVTRSSYVNSTLHSWSVVQLYIGSSHQSYPRQHVCVRSTSLTSTRKVCGIPQGSVVVAILFLIYLTYLWNLSPDCVPGAADTYLDVHQWCGWLDVLKLDSAELREDWDSLATSNRRPHQCSADYESALR